MSTKWSICTTISLVFSGDLAGRTSCLWIEMRVKHKFSLQLPCVAKTGTAKGSLHRSITPVVCQEKRVSKSSSTSRVKLHMFLVFNYLDVMSLNSSCVQFSVLGLCWIWACFNVTPKLWYRKIELLLSLALALSSPDFQDHLYTKVC